jgi:modulator of FtsH protease HflK
VSTLLVQTAQPREGTERRVVDKPVHPAGKGRIYVCLLALWAFSGVFVVPPDQQAVVTCFGAVTRPRVSPGIHYALPWPFETVYKLKVQQLRRTSIGGDLPDTVLGRSQPAASEFLTGDQNLLNVRVVVQYSVSQPKDFLFQTEDVDRLVKAVVESELSHRIAFTPVDQILTTDKVAIQNHVLQAAQRGLEEYRTGVSLSSINIEGVTPPAEVADAFRGVAGARADAVRLVNEAEGYANDLIPRARGEAAQLGEQGQSYKDGKINRAAGDAARFEAIAVEYAKAPKVTSTRAYVEAMEQILPKMKKLIVDSQGNIDLTIVGRDQNAAIRSSGAAQK